jgi:DNA-binding transcriptional ArsR family regulator
MPMLPEELVDAAARLFSLLGDPTRLRLVRELHDLGELTVGELASRTGTTLANASQHLLRLAAAELVERRRVGKSVVYRIVDPRLEQLCETVCASLRDRDESRSAA